MSVSKLQPKDRFDVVNDEILQEKHIKVQKKNMKKNNKAAERQFREYLSLKECTHTRFWEFSAEDLDNYLSHFWFATRQNKLDETTQKPKKHQSSNYENYVLCAESCVAREWKQI